MPPDSALTISGFTLHLPGAEHIVVPVEHGVVLMNGCLDKLESTDGRMLAVELKSYFRNLWPPPPPSGDGPR